MKRFSTTQSASTVNGNQLLFFGLSAWRRLSLLFTGPSTKVVAGNSLQWSTPKKIHKLHVCTLTVSGSLSEFSIKQLLRIMIHLERHHHGPLNFATYNDSNCMWYSSEFFRSHSQAPSLQIGHNESQDMQEHLQASYRFDIWSAIVLDVVLFICKG